MMRRFVVWIMTFYSMSLIGFLFFVREIFFKISDEGLLPFSALYYCDDNLSEYKPSN